MSRKTRWFLKIQTVLLSVLLVACGVKYGVIDTERLGALIGDHLTHIKQWLTTLLT